MYRVLAIDGGHFETCDECGFSGAVVDRDATVAMFRSLGQRWRAVFAHPEELIRERPAPETWCAVEYAQHVASAIGTIQWAAGEFIEGRSPVWDDAPDRPGKFEHGSHHCAIFEIDATLQIVESAAESMAQYAASLTPDEQRRTADYGSWLAIDTLAVVRHALHDAEHHLLDIRRGIARLQLAM